MQWDHMYRHFNVGSSSAGNQPTGASLFLKKWTWAPAVSLLKIYILYEPFISVRYFQYRFGICCSWSLGFFRPGTFTSLK